MRTNVVSATPSPYRIEKARKYWYVTRDGARVSKPLRFWYQAIRLANACNAGLYTIGKGLVRPC